MLRYIQGMTYDRPTIYNRLSDNIGELDEHLVKLILFNKCDSKDHQVQQVYSYLNRTANLKSSKRFPEYSCIGDAIGGYEDVLNTYIDPIKDEYSDLAPTDTSTEDTEQFISSYHDQLAERLACYGRVRKHEVVEKIEELILQYSSE